MGVTVVKPIHPSLPSANAVLASDKLGRGGNGGSGDQTLYDIGWNLSSGEVVKEAGVSTRSIMALPKGPLILPLSLERR